MAGKTASKKNLSALKRARQAEKRYLRNSTVSSKIKTLSKKVEVTVAEKNKEKLEQLLRETIKVIQSAVSKGVLHKNTASRKISRLSKLADTVLRAAGA